jgi:hypothetical protein
MDKFIIEPMPSPSSGGYSAAVHYKDPFEIRAVDVAFLVHCEVTNQVLWRILWFPISIKVLSVCRILFHSCTIDGMSC